MCKDCQNKTCLLTKKPCKEVERLLAKPYGGINGRKIVFLDPHIIETVAYQIKERGRMKKTLEYADNDLD